MRTVTVEIKMRVVMDVDEGVEVAEILDEAEITVEETTGHADIKDTSIEDYEVIDSR